MVSDALKFGAQLFIFQTQLTWENFQKMFRKRASRLKTKTLKTQKQMKQKPKSENVYSSNLCC